MINKGKKNNKDYSNDKLIKKDEDIKILQKHTLIKKAEEIKRLQEHNLYILNGVKNVKMHLQGAKSKIKDVDATSRIERAYYQKS